jgi:hypothetical protein
VTFAIYYDGSVDAERRVVTLSGVGAIEDVWKQVRERWRAILERHGVIALHMTDLMGFSGEFRRDEGWNEGRRIQLFHDLWNVLGAFHDKPLWAYTCSVLISDWERAKNEIPLLASPEYICVDFCVGRINLPLESKDEERPFSLYFDRSERFMHKVSRVWLRRRREKKFFYQIRDITAVDKSRVGIQAADMLAWMENKDACRVTYDLKALLGVANVLMIKHHCAVYDYATIVERPILEQL